MEKYCSLAGNNNDTDRDDKIIFTINVINLYVTVVTLPARDNQKLSKLFSKGFERQFTETNLKQKVIIKIQQENFDLFLNQILLESIDICFSLFKSRCCF